MRADEARRIVYDAIDEVNRQLPASRHLAKSPATIIVGPSGVLDSLGIVNLVLALEERAGDALGEPVQLLTDTALLDAAGPFSNVEALVRHLESLEGS